MLPSTYLRGASPGVLQQAGSAGTLKRLRLFSSSKLQRSCPLCFDGSVIIFDHHSGDELCSKCGLVLESKVLNDEQEWRSFSNSEGGGEDRCRVGGPNDAWMDSHSVQGTAMMGGDKKHLKLMQTHEMATAIKGGDKLLRTAFTNLKNIAEYFNLRASIVERSKEIVKDLQTAEQLKNRTGVLYMLSVIYLACREERTPRSLKEMITYDRMVTEKELGRAINRLKKLLPARSNMVCCVSTDLIPRLCQGLQLSREIGEVATYVMNKAKTLMKSHKPNSLIAAAIYLMTQLCELNIDPSDIAAKAKTGTSTVLAVYKEMLPLSSSLLPSNFNPSKM